MHTCKFFITFAKNFVNPSVLLPAELPQIAYHMSINEYIEQHTTPENDTLLSITRDTHLHVLNPRMMSGHVQGRVLSMLSHMLRPHRILELGTFTGYSALCLAEGLSAEGQLVTIEHNDELEDTIRQNLQLSPLGNQIKLLIGDALPLLEQMRQEGEQFELVFLDADKREYKQYLEHVYPLLPIGGFVLADNVLWDGHIIDPEYDRDRQTIALREFNDYVAQSDLYEQVILPLRDGLTIIRKVR